MIYTCTKCGFEIKASIKKHVSSCDGRGPRRKRKKIGHSTKGGWNKGKSLKETHPDTHTKIRKKLSDNHKGSGKAATEEAEINRKIK